MRYLILVRHSSPEIDQSVPGNLWHLSEEGRRRARLLAGQLAFYHPLIFSSVEPKAMETASILSSSLGLPFETSEGLHENDRTGVGYLGRAEFEAAISRFFALPNELHMGQETATQARQRFTTAVETLLHKHARRNLLIVTHGTVMTLFVAHSTKIAPFPFWQSLDTPAFVILPLP